MKQSTIIFIVMFVLLPIIAIEARGGRGRGGIGGLFGKWRKTKSKPTNPRHSDRPLSNRMPMYTTGTKQRPSKTHQQHVFHSRTQTGKGTHNRYHTNTQYVPPGATHYATHDAIPAGAVYVPHTPPYTSSSELIDFLSGYMTGRLLSISTYPHQHVHHIHYQQISQDAGQKVIIIENGTVTKDTSRNFWPMDSDVPLSPFNSSFASDNGTNVVTDPLFKRVTPTTPPSMVENNSNSSTTNSITQTPPGGIICMAMLFNETDSADNNKIIQVEKLVCFPAPPPPPPMQQGPDESNCVIRYFIESNPNNPSETITVPRKHCNPSTTERSEPVVGDINTEEV